MNANFDVDRAPSWSPLSSSESRSGRSSSNRTDVSSERITHASSLSHRSQDHLVSSNWSLSKEAQDFIHDLQNFLPLGCLTCPFTFRKFNNSSLWTEITRIPDDADISIQIKHDARKLNEAGWIRIFINGGALLADATIFRIYIIPGDAGHRFVDRHNRGLTNAIESLVRLVDVSPSTWQGNWSAELSRPFDLWATADPGSLFYIFNNIPSPSPSPDSLQNGHDREALQNLLDPENPPVGLKTKLYPYQRRSAALMLQRESEVRSLLDPRLEKRTAPNGSTFYYGARDFQILRNPRLYESTKGGILAETMGLGKTIICVALIVATKGHLPKTPADYDVVPVRPRVGSLVDMAITAVNRHSLPWKASFESIERNTGESMSHCAQLLRSYPPTYEIPQLPSRWNRNTIVPKPKKLRLASTTVIVVPRNLCSQWQSELQKHVDDGALAVLVMDDSKKTLPPPDELAEYDVILFSRSRFELEIRDGSDTQGRRLSRLPLTCQCWYIGASRIRDCTCLRPDDIYDSPLKHLHFLRLVIDEGHFFSASKSTAAQVASTMVEADHRWVVSGTPAKDLLGVEMDLYSSESVPMALNDSTQRKAILDQRKEFNAKEDTAGAVSSIGRLASSFFKIRPWAGADGERPAQWENYIYRHEDRKATNSAFSYCLRHTLESIVVKTRPEDVERDIELPPLTHNIVRLEPSFFDKLTANLFTLVLTANAVTSERTDVDYLFHKNSQKARYQLIHNLRQSAFFWTGFSVQDVKAAVEHGHTYLNNKEKHCSEEDRQLLTSCMSQAQVVLDSAGWKALSQTHEIGLFVDEWPTESEEYWSFDSSQQPLLSGCTQLLEAQTHVNNQASANDPAEGLSGAGIRALANARNSGDAGTKKKAGADEPVLVKLGIPSSSMTGEPTKRRSSLSKPQSRRQSVLSFKVAKTDKGNTVTKKQVDTEGQKLGKPSSKGGQANGLAKSNVTELEATSSLRRTSISGTTSAKLSYLISQILLHYQDEKILIFYDGDNVAYYIAQVLELMHIPHLIYAKSLTPAQKSRYIVRFDQESHFRVLLMDVQQAAFGLNLSSASRVFFVNPVCRPSVEAQAIKRAHRIGQTRPVVVETLILRGTIEEEMFERSKRMTRAEHKDAKVLEDDGGIRDIIQNARPLHISTEERHKYGQVAMLKTPQQLWSRQNWATWSAIKTKEVDEQAKSKKRQRDGSAVSSPAPSASTDEVEVRIPRPAKRQKIKLRFSKVTDDSQPGTIVSASSEPGGGVGERYSRQESEKEGDPQNHPVSIFGGQT